MADGPAHAAQIGDDEDPLVVADLSSALLTLREQIDHAAFPLETLTAASARAERRRALDQLDDYLLPRMAARTAPLLVVVGGSTGAGKSTLVNSILGEHVTTPGALRPTTRSPVLVHHPLDAPWFTDDRVFPHLARETSGPSTGTGPARAAPRPDRDGAVRSLRLVATDVLPPGLALLDAPDVDSVVVGNRDLAAQLLAAADLWLFVTTAARYADAVPWALLAEGATRGAQIAVVVDRVDPGAEAVAADLRRMLAEQGLADAPVFVVAETPLDEGLLPVGLVAPVSRWLTAVGSDPAARDAVVAATRDGAVDDLAARVLVLADAADAQAAAQTTLRRHVTHAYSAARADVAAATSDGSMLRGEVLSRWQDLVGTGELMRAVEEKISALRDAISGFFRGRPATTPTVAVAIGHSLEAVVFDAADKAAERVYTAWQQDAAGAALGDVLELSRASAALRGDLAQQVRAWQGDVLALVTERGAGKRGRARLLAVGVNGIGAALMIVVFASTGGVTGAEVGIAGGTVVLAQRLLEGVFGDEAVRGLAREADALLEQRVAALMDAESARFTSRLDALDVDDGAGPALRAAAYTVQRTAGRDRAERPATPATHVPLGGDAPRAGALRGADLPPGPDPYGSAPVPPPPPPAPAPRHRGVFSRLFGRRPAADPVVSGAPSPSTGLDGGHA